MNIRSIGLVILFSITGLLSAPLLAQNDEPLLDERYDNWYQIELIIFDRLASQSAQAEAWPNNIQLLYPPQLDFLFTAEEWQEHISPPQIENSDAGEFGENVALLSNQSDDSLLYNSELKISESDEAASTINDDNQQLDLTNDEVAASSNVDLNEALPLSEAGASDQIAPVLPEMETPRIKLEEDDKELSREQARLNLRPGLRVLFHEAWRQPLSSSEESVAIVITGGDKVEDHHELEGSIRISLNRFLHFKTNLWRNFFVPNYGQEVAYWPPLPKLPEPVKPTFNQKLEDSQELETNHLETFEPSVQSNLDSFSYFPDKAETTNQFNLSSSDLNSDQGTLNLNLGTTYGQTNPKDFNFSIDNTLDATASANLVSEIITLKQSRRMRSNELHYIDHPRLGIIVKISPYEVELPQLDAAINEEGGELDTASSSVLGG